MAARPTALLTAFVVAAGVWSVAAAVCGLWLLAGGPGALRWLALHLVLVGGASQLVLGAAQFFATAFLTTDAPPWAVARAQLAAWNAGTAAVAVGVLAVVPGLAVVGGVLLLVAVALVDRALRAMRRRSLQRMPWATRWYRSALAWLVAGVALGVALALGAPWPRPSLLATHLAVTLGGWLGTAIVGTLHTLLPTLTGTRLARPRLEPRTHAVWSAGIAALALGGLSDLRAPAVAGWALLLVAALMLVGNLLAGAGRATDAGAPAAVLALAQVDLVATAVLGLALSLGPGAGGAMLSAGRELLALTALGGWIALTVGGALLHLLRVLGDRGGGAPSGGREPLALAGAAVVVVGVALALLGHLAGAVVPSGLGPPLVALGHLLIAARLLALTVRALRAGALRG